MRTRIKILAIAVFVLAVVGFSAIAGAERGFFIGLKPPPPPTRQPRNQPGLPVNASGTDGILELKVSLTKSSFQVGEIIEVHMSIKNIAKQSVTLVYPVGGLFDFEIYDSKGNKLGAWSELAVTKKLAPPIVVELKPGETIEQTMEWDQKLRTTALTPGAFELVGVFGGQVAKGAEGRGYLKPVLPVLKTDPLMFNVTSP